jgi:hypothetical protein
MQRSDLEKLNKEELIELILTMYDRFQIKIMELEARINQNSKNSSTPHQKTHPGKNPKPYDQKQANNKEHKKDTKDTA